MGTKVMTEERGGQRRDKKNVKCGIALMHDRVLVRVKDPEKMTKSKMLYIPSTAQQARELPMEADVVAVGPGRYHNDSTFFIKTEVEPGDTIIFDRHAGVQADPGILDKYVENIDDGATYLILRELSIMAKVLD